MFKGLVLHGIVYDADPNLSRAHILKKEIGFDGLRNVGYVCHLYCMHGL